ncbi:hypothetical protein G7Y89_g5873 [Cudoniella acicularis]|uniref:1,3-beta-glucanosyltransferase n=1 Tax=Cudoniella acicularis TaxID=354080 RepID=A0A8H4RLN6_9HELO|nr:hypothetical protein G7Y89_g5873 [Cudoniella acicularis]
MFGLLLHTVLLALATLDTVNAALPTISVKGAKFFANGQQFFIKGVAYQGTPSDPLVDTQQCQLDATLMQSIGANSIRVYHIDPYSNHDGCMNAFASAGIYVWLDLDTFNTTIVQTAPTWTDTQFIAFVEVMDIFAGYKNLAGFWIGNEVINEVGGSSSAPFIKAAVHDMKEYMAAKSYRRIPIGYSAADIAELRPMLQNYLTCGSDYNASIDFFGLNSYEWCGDSSYQTSGYAILQAMSQDYPVPTFFSETGCNVSPPRTFTDQAAIFGPNMTGTWSGSIIYEWCEEMNNYGLVNYPNGQIYNGAPQPLQPDFDNLSNQWKNINPSGVAESAYTPSLTAPGCPLPTGGWGVNGNVPLPTLDQSVVEAYALSGVKPTQVATTASSSTSVAAQTTVASSSAPTTAAAVENKSLSTATLPRPTTTTSRALGAKVAVQVGSGLLWWIPGLLV